MRVRDFFGVQDAHDAEALVAIFGRRSDRGFNEFWLGTIEGAFPSLCVFVNGDLAKLFYFPEGGHPGFRAIGRLATLDPAGTTDVSTDYDDEPLPAPNKYVVPASAAIRAAQEFFLQPGLPRSLEWFEL